MLAEASVRSYNPLALFAIGLVWNDVHTCDESRGKSKGSKLSGREHLTLVVNSINLTVPSTTRTAYGSAMLKDMAR